MMERINTTEVREKQSDNVSEVVKVRNGVSLRSNGWPVFELEPPGGSVRTGKSNGGY